MNRRAFFQAIPGLPFFPCFPVDTTLVALTTEEWQLASQLILDLQVAYPEHVALLNKCSGLLRLAVRRTVGERVPGPVNYNRAQIKRRP